MKGIIRGKTVYNTKGSDGRVPVSRSAYYAGMETGMYPKPIKIGKRSVAWREEDIDELVEKIKGGYVFDEKSKKWVKPQ